MSTTAIVRSPSASSGLVGSSSPSTPASITKTVLPKLDLTPKAKSTPAQTPPKPSTPGSSTPGHWTHPRMQEVIQRQNKTNFDKGNLWNTGVNVAAIAVTFATKALLYPAIPTSALDAMRPYDTYALLLIYAFFTVNIFVALLPLFRTKDNCEDIPLTPAQRQLLGLPPMSRPATPQEKEQWITPPRYTRSRSATPQSPASSLRAQASGSPSSASLFGGTPQREGSGSPFSPSSYSPMRSGAGAGGERRRLSYNARSSPLGASDFDASTASTTTGFGGLESTGTPTRKGNRASVGLNNKWLYEKGMGLGKGGSPRGGTSGAWDPKGWGTGSVFN